MSSSHNTPGEPIVATLSDDRLSELFHQKVLPRGYLPQLPTTPSRHPKAVVIGGQPGAGKTSVSGRLAPGQDFATVNGDDLRAFHPQFDQIIHQHPERMAELTAGVSGQLVAASISWLIAHHFNLTWETTFPSGDALVRDLARARSAGYDVDVWAWLSPARFHLRRQWRVGLRKSRAKEWVGR